MLLIKFELFLITFGLFVAALMRYYLCTQVIAIQEISPLAVANQVLSFEWHQATHTNLPCTTLWMIRTSTQTYTLMDCTSPAAEMAMILPDLFREVIASIIRGTSHQIIPVGRIGITPTIILLPTIRLSQGLLE